MNVKDLRVRLSGLGLDANYVAFANRARGERPQAGPAYTIVTETSGVSVYADSGRADPFQKPYDGYVFDSENAAADYVWRMARRAVAPHLLSAEEIEANRRDAEATVARRAQMN